MRNKVIQFLLWVSMIPSVGDNDFEYKPFGEGRWLCLNAAANHYLKPVITNLVITLSSNTKKPVGTFSCSCEMVYCRTSPDETDEDKLRIGKIKRFGSDNFP